MIDVLLASHLHQIFAVFAVCMSGLAALAMVLRHLREMRVTTGEVAVIRELIATLHGGTERAISATDKKLKELNDHLVAVDNRTRR